jgi:hypothetical protein
MNTNYQTLQPTSSKEFAMQAKPEKTPAAKRKQPSPKAVDASIRGALMRAAPDGRLPCAVAFKVATDLQKPPAEIGEAADRLTIRLVKCQLGLFGYSPEKKIVKAVSSVKPELENAIRQELVEGRLACQKAWELAEAFQKPRMAISAVCEALGIKIKPCQLGAF